MAGGALAWKVLGTGAAVAAGVGTRKALTTTWRLGTGSPPPVNPASPDTSWREAVGWAMVSGAAVGLARMYATRRLAGYWRRSTGHLPKGMETVAP